LGVMSVKYFFIEKSLRSETSKSSRKLNILGMKDHYVGETLKE